MQSVGCMVFARGVLVCQFNIADSGFERLEESGALLKSFCSCLVPEVCKGAIMAMVQLDKLQAVPQTQLAGHMPVTRISSPRLLATTAGEDLGTKSARAHCFTSSEGPCKPSFLRVTSEPSIKPCLRWMRSIESSGVWYKV